MAIDVKYNRRSLLHRRDHHHHHDDDDDYYYHYHYAAVPRFFRLTHGKLALTGVRIVVSSSTKRFVVHHFELQRALPVIKIILKFSVKQVANL